MSEFARLASTGGCYPSRPWTRSEPDVCPLATAEEVVIIVELEDRHPSWGPQKLARLLARRLGSTAPSPSTIARVLRSSPQG